MIVCTTCGNEFQPSDEEMHLRKRLGLGAPQQCPDCRMQRRMAFRNEQTLYHRKCDLSAKQIISMYAPDSPYTVYEASEWHSDAWDALDYGRTFDFKRDFFSQMHELMLDVPKISRFAINNHNSDFSNGAQQNKDCYMVFVSDHNEDCYYSYSIFDCSDCLECLNCFKCTLCLECLDCTECYQIAFSERSHGCRESAFLSDCRSCSNCFLCCGLRNKQYHILNQPYSKEDYEQKVAQLLNGSRSTLTKLKKKFSELVATQQVHQYYNGQKNEQVTGDHITHSRNSVWCFDSNHLEDCAHLTFGNNSNDCVEGYVVVDNCERCYEIISAISQYNTQFTYSSWHSKNSQYLDHCVSCSDCFACSGLKRQQYCIFNVQYSKEEYFALKEQILRHMKQTGEFEKPFPITLSPFAYNETVAQDYYPLDEKSCRANGWAWRTKKNEKTAYQGPEIDVPQSIDEVDDEITKTIFSCATSGKQFKFIPQEIKLYRTHRIPLPDLCFNERHITRIQRRNPRWLWKRTCANCHAELESSYAPQRPEKVLCESCYIAEVS